jgi:hypothetical protein
MRRNSGYLILLITVALITTIFAGCVTAPPPAAPAVVPLNIYHPGDVVSDKPTDGYGMLILKYDPATDVYIGRSVGRMEDGWVWLNDKPVSENRLSVERVNIYKTGNISDPSVVGQL